MRGSIDERRAPNDSRESGDLRPEPSGALRRAGAAATVIALVTVLAMIVVGLVGILDRPSRGERAAPSGPAPSPTGAASPIELADVVAVSVSSGRATTLAPSLRSEQNPEHFQVSPDGRWAAFDSADDIFVARLDGTKKHVVASIGGATTPSWSPDGRRLVYSDGARVFVLDLASGGIRPVTEPHGETWHPNFSPDGETILFTRKQHGELALFTVPASGGGERRLLDLPGAMNAAFGTYGPDGTIAFRRTDYDGSVRTEMTEDRIWLADEDGLNRRSLRTCCGSMSQIEGDALWPAWSPDGTRIAYEPLYEAGVFVIDVRTNAFTRIAREGVHPTWLDDDTLIIEDFEPLKEMPDPASVLLVDVESGHAAPGPWHSGTGARPEHVHVSPDGSRMAFDAGGKVYVAGIGGRRARVIASAWNASSPSWSPDGRSIVFTSDDDVLLVDVATGRRQRLARVDGRVWYPNFSPDGESVLFTRELAPSGRRELWTVPATGGAARPLLVFRDGTDAAFGVYGPDGAIAYRRSAYDPFVWLADSSGRPIGRLGDGNHTPMPTAPPWALWPSWSPDGTRIAFQERFGTGGVVVVDLRTGRTHEVFAGGGNVSWFDDETLIIDGVRSG